MNYSIRKKVKIALGVLVVVVLSIIVVFIQFSTKGSFKSIESDLRKVTSRNLELVKVIEVGNKEFALYTYDKKLGIMEYSELIFGRYKREGGVNFDNTENSSIASEQVYISKAKSSYIVLFGANKDSKIDSIEIKVSGKSNGYEDKTTKFKLLKENYFIISTEIKGDVQSITAYDVNNKDITPNYIKK